MISCDVKAFRSLLHLNLLGCILPLLKTCCKQALSLLEYVTKVFACTQLSDFVLKDYSARKKLKGKFNKN